MRYQKPARVMVLVLGALVAASASAQGAVIRSASQLAGDPSVKKLEQPYRMVSAAHGIHSRCSEAYGLQPAQKQFIDIYYKEISTSYLDAFMQAYIARFRAPPPKELAEDFARYISAVQKDAMNAILSNIEKHGCEHRSVRDILGYFDKVQREAQAKTSAAETPPRSKP